MAKIAKISEIHPTLGFTEFDLSLIHISVGDWCGQYAERLDPEKVAPDAPFGNFGDEYAVTSRRYYYATITFIDDQIGEIIAVLKERGMYDNCLLYTSTARIGLG